MLKYIQAIRRRLGYRKSPWCCAREKRLCPFILPKCDRCPVGQTVKEYEERKNNA